MYLSNKKNAQDFAMSKNSLILVSQKQTRESNDRHDKDTN